MGKTRLEKLNPAITALAEQVIPGAKITYRQKTYWLRSLQLTYENEVIDDKPVPLDEAGKAALAERILRRVLAAREQPEWGDRWTRQRRVLIEMRRIVADVKPGFFNHATDDSLDDGYFWHSTKGHWKAIVVLVGDPLDVPLTEAIGATPLDALDALWTKLANGETSPWMMS